MDNYSPSTSSRVQRGISNDGQTVTKAGSLFYKVVLGSLIILLTSCGFKLRGMVDMPPWLDDISIVMQNGRRDLPAQLSKQFKIYGVHVNSDPSQAHYVLVVEKDSLQKQITSVSASTTPRQYQMIYSIWYTLRKQNGEIIINSRVATVTRQVTTNNDRILGSDAEESLVVNAMQRDAVMQIISQITR